MSIWQAVTEDATFHYGARPVGIRGILRAISNPSLVAAFSFRAATARPVLLRRIFRWVCIVFFASDVSPNARLSGPIDLPHPVGIVIGNGSIIGRHVRIYQNVTIGSSRSGRYPMIRDEVTIYSNAVIAGGVEIGHGSVVGANCTVTSDVSPGAVIRHSNSSR